MASPIGHALAGYALGRIGDPPDAPRVTALSAACAVLAIAPDLDFLPGIVLGTPALYHQGASHSLLAALLVGALAAAAVAPDRSRFPLCMALCGAAYASHMLFDFFGPDTRPPIGVPLLWPVSDAAFLSPVTLLPGIRHAASSATGTWDWLGFVFSLRNVGAILFEVALTAPLLVLVELWRRRSQRRAGLGNA